LDEVATEAFRTRADGLGETIRARLETIAGAVPAVGEVRGLGPMLAIELVDDPLTKRPAAALARRTTEIARERGLVLLSCGLYGNVIRVLVPILAEESDVDEGLAILEASLFEAASSGG